MMRKGCPGGNHSKEFLLSVILAFISFLIPYSMARLIREDLAGEESGMDELEDPSNIRLADPSNIRLYIPDGRERLERYESLMRGDNQEKEEEEEEGEYEDFPQEPTVLQRSYFSPENNKDQIVYRAPSKRYLGIEIPDYVSSPSKGSILKTIQNRMKAAGRK